MMDNGSNAIALSRFRSMCLVLIAITLFMGVFPSGVVFAQEIPAGFQLVAEQPGVALYRKDYPGGTPDYVQLIDLNQGASLDLLYGEPVGMDNAHNRGMFGGSNPSFRQQSIRTFWDNYTSSQVDAFCVSNGQFFYMPESPTPLALPLLVDHQLLAEGFGYSQYPEKQLILALWPSHADILPLTPENLYNTDAANVIGGLTAEANKKPKNAVGRTFVGILDQDGDQLYETVLLYTTQTATQAEADRTVRSFGAAKVMMLDGGGSTQLICQGQAYIDTTRAIPQALGVSAGVEVMSAPNRQETAAPESLHSETAAEAIPATNTKEDGLPQASGRQELASSAEATSQILTQPESQPAGEPVSAPADPGVVSTSLTASVPNLESAQNNEITVSNLVPSSEEQSISNSLKGIISTPPAAEALDTRRLTSLGPAQTFSRPVQSGQHDHASGLDVLWLPAIISPLSVFLFYIGRRQIMPLYRD